ncbi:MAG: hypothetical protein ABI430_04670 [Candidatus Taylorbacteria bacterium]
MKSFLKNLTPNTSHLTPTRGGFTLIETFIAITILMMVIVGPLTLAQRSLSSASLTKDKLTAYFLAQDAIEYIKKMRDDKVLGAVNTSGWTDFINGDIFDCSGNSNDVPQCTIDTLRDSSSAINHCTWGFCPYLKYYETRNSYGYVQGTPSPFKRGVKVMLLDNGFGQNEMQVEVTVEWQSQGFGKQTVVLNGNLLNW